MKVEEILASVAHRPSKLPTTKWSYYQRWKEVIFLHFQVDYQTLRKFVPEELEIDLFDKKAWVSIVAFSMDKVRLRHLPSFRPISSFYEFNIRTYVKSKDKTGIYFLSIEASKWLSCKLISALSDVYYRYSKIKRDFTSFFCQHKKIGDKFELQYKEGNDISAPSPLDNWLVERYVLFEKVKNSILEYQVHHIKWPLQEVEIKNLAFSYPRFNGLINRFPDKMHYSKGVEVLLWDK